MDRITTRVATESDALMLARLRYEFRSSFHQVREDEATFVDRCTVWMRERLRSESLWKCWIAEFQDTAVGNVWVQLVEKIPNPIEEPEHYVYLTNFYVREQHRSHGVGSMLLSEILAWARSRNIKTVILWPTERSKPFYMRHGFDIAGDFMQLTITTPASN
ncbi:MAG TPA: GNAT family N-acetyltransferase [Pyrinomonadaceae bacterium]